MNERKKCFRTFATVRLFNHESSVSSSSSACKACTEHLWCGNIKLNDNRIEENYNKIKKSRYLANTYFKYLKTL